MTVSSTLVRAMLGENARPIVATMLMTEPTSVRDRSENLLRKKAGCNMLLTARARAHRPNDSVVRVADTWYLSRKATNSIEMERMMVIRHVVLMKAPSITSHAHPVSTGIEVCGEELGLSFSAVIEVCEEGMGLSLKTAIAVSGGGSGLSF